MMTEQADNATVVHPPASIGSLDWPPPRDPAVIDWLQTRSMPINDHCPSLTFRHSGWAGDRQLIYDAMRRTGQTPARQSSYCHCGSHAYILRSIDNPDHYRVAGSACHDRFCLPCSRERARSLSLSILDVIGTDQIRMATLTLRHHDDGLTAHLDRLAAAYAVLRKRPEWQARVVGAIGMIETVWQADTHRWHVHMHLLIKGRYVPHAMLSDLWLQATGDSPIVHIMRPKSVKGVARYVVKYATKALDSSYIRHPDALDEAVLALKGRRLCTTTGCYRGSLRVAEPDPEGWEHIGTLDTYLARAADGDQEALAVLNSINSPALAHTITTIPDRPRPPPPPAVSQRHRQMMLAADYGYRCWPY